MHLGNAFVITAEKRNEVLRKIMLVGVGQRAHDAEIQRDILAVCSYLDITGMHVRMEKSIAENLRIKDLHPVPGQFWEYPLRRFAIHLPD